MRKFLPLCLVFFGLSTILKAQSIADIVAGSNVHNILEVAIDAAGLQPTLDGPGTFTLFAPTDAAFLALPQGVIDLLLADPTGALNDVLLYHAVGSVALSTDLSDGQDIVTINGQSVTVTILSGNVFINNAQVTTANILADNGVVHVIDAVLVPEGIICTDFAAGPYNDFNTIFDGAPQTVGGVGEVNQITGFQAFASESYLVNNFVQGTEYTFSICNGPAAGTWDAELTIFGPGGGLVAIEQNCSITFVAPVDGTYLIGIQEAGFCGDDSSNLLVNNGFPTLSSNGSISVYDIIATSGVHNTLEAAIDAAALNGTLSGDGSFTVFAPTDAAFAALPASLIGALLTDPSGVLTDILLYHVLDGQVLSSQLPATATVPTLNGQTVDIEVTADGVTVNGAQVIIADLIGNNGVVHVIDAVLIPSDATTVYDVVVASSDHTTLETAINLADLDETLDGPGTFTLFAPTDAAFSNLPDGLLNSLLGDPSLLGDVLLYHALGDIALSTSLVNGPVATLFGETVNITVSGSGVMVNNAMVTVADIVTINGVVHVIDAVLVPTTLGVEEIASLNTLSLFPNPAVNQVNLEFDLATSERIAVDVVNLAGQVVKSVEFGQRSVGFNRVTFDVNDLAGGFYLVNIQVGADQIAQKLHVSK